MVDKNHLTIYMSIDLLKIVELLLKPNALKNSNKWLAMSSYKYYQIWFFFSSNVNEILVLNVLCVNLVEIGWIKNVGVELLSLKSHSNSNPNYLWQIN